MIGFLAMGSPVFQLLEEIMIQACGLWILLISRQGWNVPLISSCFCADDAAHILDIPLSKFWPKDCTYWWFQADGMLSVKCAYRLGMLGHTRAWQLIQGQHENEIWRLVCSLDGPLKFMHFLWHTCKGRLADKEASSIDTL